MPDRFKFDVALSALIEKEEEPYAPEEDPDFMDPQKMLQKEIDDSVMKAAGIDPKSAYALALKKNNKLPDVPGSQNVLNKHLPKTEEEKEESEE